MQESFYFKISFTEIKEELIQLMEENKNLRPVFCIDLGSINKTAFNERVILTEISELKKGIENYYLMNDYKKFLHKLDKLFLKYNPMFITFFDSGGSKQNKDIDSMYKAQRVGKLDTMIEKEIITLEDKNIYQESKKLNLSLMLNDFNIKDKSIIISLDHYESDLVGHYITSEKLIPNALTINLSNDKDLLQSCRLPNTIQITTVYKPTTKKTEIKIWNDKNAIFKLEKKEELRNTIMKLGYELDNHPFASKYISLLLSLGGDVPDNIPNVYKRKDPNSKKRMGFTGALKLIHSQSIPANYTPDFKLKGALMDHEKELFLNFQLVSFDEQIKRLPKEIINKILTHFE